MKLRRKFPTKESLKATLRNKKVSIPLTAFILFLGALVWSILTVLVAPGTDSVTARLAEWGRDHYLGSVITLAENIQYKLNPPKVGGTPSSDVLKSFTTPASPNPEQPVPLAALAPLATPQIAGEGEFKTVYSINKTPAIQIAYLRPDQSHTSYLAGVAVMSSKLLQFKLHPGFLEPGRLSNFTTTDMIVNADLPNLVATFNGGFKLKDSKGGYFSEGFTAKPLENGAASFVIYADGHADIGAWGSDITMASTVVSVRQNLSLLIDKGAITPDLDKNALSKWGYTIKNANYVWRSGVGIKADGDIVYAAGNALSVQSLANLLFNAGAVRAMELDINPQWVSYMWYPADTKTSPQKLLAFDRPASRYLQKSSRDFFSVSVR